MEGLKIAYVFYDRPDYCAGPRINALRLLPELARRGHHVTALIGYKKGCPAKDILEKSGVEVIATEWPAFVEDQVEWLYSCLETADPDIFVPNISVSGCYAARYVREAGRPTIAGHLSDDKFNWGMAERFCQRGDDWAVSGMFCMGTEHADTICSWPHRKTRVVIIPAGVPIPKVLASQRDPIRLVYSGRLEDRQKRICDVTRAIISALKRFPYAIAKIIGDGSQRLAVEEMIRDSDVGDRIELSGYVAPERVQEEIATGNILVLLSDYEGVPGAVMDAMSCGLIPVCLDIPGGLRELVIHEKTGLLVTDREASFQQAVSRLSHDTDLRYRLAASAREHIEEGFSLKKAADRWEQLFVALLSDAGSRQPIKFPTKPVLPRPFRAIGREDKRRPSPSSMLFRACTRLPQKVSRWIGEHFKRIA